MSDYSFTYEPKREGDVVVILAFYFYVFLFLLVFLWLNLMSMLTIQCPYVFTC